MTKNSITVIITSIVLGVFYMFLMSSASNGYGYMGYNGYHSSPSFWYWGGASNVYYDRDIHNGSRSGPRTLGGGPGSGK